MTMKYKGYESVVKFDDEARIFHGEVLNIRDVVTFQGSSVHELEAAFRGSVDDYLTFCEERGEEPNKPFSGHFLVRTDPELHKEAATAAAREGKSLNAWFENVLRTATRRPSATIHETSGGDGCSQEVFNSGGKRMGTFVKGDTKKLRVKITNSKSARARPKGSR